MKRSFVPAAVALFNLVAFGIGCSDSGPTFHDPMTGTGGGSGGAIGGTGGAPGSGGANPGTGGTTLPDAGGGGTSADTAADMPVEMPVVPCPGAGKSLHFQDDVNKTTTNSMQVLADLGDDTPIGDSARTIEFWAYMEGLESWKAEHSIIEYGGTGRCEAFGIDGGDGGMMGAPSFDPFTFSSGGPCKGDDNVSIMPTPPRTGWLHLAWVYDPAGQLSYNNMQNLNFMLTVNGVPQPIPDMKQMGKLLTKKTLVSIGSGERDVNQGFTGKIDEFRMWNVARTAQQIADNYKFILKGDEPGLVAYYHFDDGTGMTVKDSSSKHHDAMFAAGHPAPTWVDSTDLTLTCK